MSVGTANTLYTLTECSKGLKRYIYYVVQEVEKRNMPMEIALLPIIESAYNPIARSNMKAVGLWQFIPSTGKNYGLKQNWWKDERSNVILINKCFSQLPREAL